jgi:hypothetical protein
MTMAPKQIKSLGYRSEQIFTNFDGKVEVREDYFVIRTLTNPNFFWGNLLLFNRPPKLGDFETWLNLFKKEFPDPCVYHVTVAWDTPNGEVGDPSEFIAQGFELECNAVLTAQSVRKPPKYNNQLFVRALANDGDWDQMVNLQVASADNHLPREEWLKFYVSQSLRYKAMSKAGLGDWYGGFIDGKLVAGLGLFYQNGIGRFQQVCTDPNYRRQGICGTLVYQTSLLTLKYYGVRDLVMCADPDYFALKIYESVGFQQTNIDYGLCWWDRNYQQRRQTPESTENFKQDSRDPSKV